MEEMEEEMIEEEVYEIPDDDDDQEDGVEDYGGEDVNLVELEIGQFGMGPSNL